MEHKRWVACWGNPVDGFHFVGSFETAADCIQWCEESIYTDSWWFIEVLTPEEFKKENEG
jgi:hypothetical protein